MVEISKHLFQAATADLSCSYLIHPWHKNCLQGSLLCYKEVLQGSMKFYAFVYTAQILMRGKQMFKGKEEWRKMGEYYARSSLFGFLVCGTACSLPCLYSSLTGSRTIPYYIYIVIPNMINGLAIYLEPPSRRGLIVNLFCNLMIEYWLKSLQKTGLITLSKNKQTLLFMMGSSILFYLMRLEGDKDQRTPLFWLFTPEKVRWKTEEWEKPCPHKGTCTKHILNGFSKLFGAGLAITLARVVLPKIRTPIRAVSSIKRDHFKMAMFFGSYIGIYRAVVCYLCRKRGYDSPLYALPAGYLAGLSFLFNPNLGFSIASATAAVKLFSTILYERNILPSNVPLPELMYCISQSTLFNARFMHPEVCPKYIFNLMKQVSNGCSERLYANLVDAVKKVS